MRGPGRHETPEEREDRKWDDVLQELRVIQTGTQLVAGFLLTLPLQQRFGDLDRGNKGSTSCWCCWRCSRRHWSWPPWPSTAA